MSFRWAELHFHMELQLLLFWRTVSSRWTAAVVRRGPRFRFFLIFLVNWPLSAISVLGGVWRPRESKTSADSHHDHISRNLVIVHSRFFDFCVINSSKSKAADCFHQRTFETPKKCRWPGKASNGVDRVESTKIVRMTKSNLIASLFSLSLFF